jgi:hypothetical protein
VILPMTVLRRLDAVLEPTKQAVLDMKTSLDKAKITNQDQALRQAAGQAFYNTSTSTLRDLKARTSQQHLKADFEAYLDGFSPNVQDILDDFEFRNQIPRLSKADALGTLIDKFLSPDIDLSPKGLDNHGMGTLFEELVRRFNDVALRSDFPVLLVARHTLHSAKPLSWIAALTASGRHGLATDHGPEFPRAGLMLTHAPSSEAKSDQVTNENRRLSTGYVGRRRQVSLAFRPA